MDQMDVFTLCLKIKPKQYQIICISTLWDIRKKIIKFFAHAHTRTLDHTLEIKNNNQIEITTKRHAKYTNLICDHHFQQNVLDTTHRNRHTHTHKHRVLGYGMALVTVVIRLRTHKYTTQCYTNVSIGFSIIGYLCTY